MHFDDRLDTVLRQGVSSDAIARVVYRQLLDLLGTSLSSAQGPRIDAAYLRLAEISGAIPARERAKLLQEPVLRLRNPRLVAELAGAEPQVAAAAIARAQLTDDQWLDLIPALPVSTRHLIRNRRGLGLRVEALLDRLGIAYRPLPPAEVEELTADAAQLTAAEFTSADLAHSHQPGGIGKLVKRIEAFRKTRQPLESSTISANGLRLPLGDDPDTPRQRRAERIDFVTDGAGSIVWADPATAPMVAGLKLAVQDALSPAQSSPDLAASFRQRRPIANGRLAIAGAPAVAGAWRVDAAPRFEKPAGRFTGYVGRMRRPAAAGAGDLAAPGATVDSDSDRMRQLLHELRTPVNAIQGFAEVIQQQLFGPTPHEYRALAAAIAGDSARILAGFEELERLIKLDSGELSLDPGECDLVAVVAATATQLEAFTRPRSSGFKLRPDASSLPVAMAQHEVERLVWRLLAVLAGASAPGEVLRLRLRQRGAELVVSVDLPASLAACEGDALFDAVAGVQQQALVAGMFGTGFALRLARTEAQAAGGSLERRGDKLRLALPGLTRTAGGHSQVVQ